MKKQEIINTANEIIFYSIVNSAKKENQTFRNLLSVTFNYSEEFEGDFKSLTRSLDRKLGGNIKNLPKWFEKNQWIKKVEGTFYYRLTAKWWKSIFLSIASVNLIDSDKVELVKNIKKAKAYQDKMDILC